MSNIIVNVDTDSFIMAKSDGAIWTKQEQDDFLLNLNNQFPEKIKWEHDGIFSAMVVFKSKNYALIPEGTNKIKTKGSSIRDTKKEPALREMMDKMIECLLTEREGELVDIYKKYCFEALNVTDIKRWCSKKTITKAILKCEDYTEEDIKNKLLRRNETNVWDAIKDGEFREGDKAYLFPAILSSTTETKNLKNGKIKEKVTEITGLKMNTTWIPGAEDKMKLLSRVYATLKIFSTVVDIDLFVEYNKVKNKSLLEELN